MSRRAVFLDRDGTLNIKPSEHAYITSQRDFVWLRGAQEAVARLARAGYVITVVSNQRGVGRGLVTTNVLREIEAKIQHDLALHGCGVEAFRYCFHRDEDRCTCRKPKPGMILVLAKELDLDVGSSWVIGDAPSDVAAGKAAGCLTALVNLAGTDASADLVVPSLAAASAEIAARVGSSVA